MVDRKISIKKLKNLLFMIENNYFYKGNGFTKFGPMKFAKVGESVVKELKNKC